MSKIPGVTLVLLLSLLAGIGVVVADDGVDWGYEGARGPEYWGALSRHYSDCSEGREQSPIDVPATAMVHPADIAFNYQPTVLSIVNNGHTIKVSQSAGSSMTVEGKTYNLLQFHFHSPSEHTFDGEYDDMEMHLVHQSDDGEYAVVGVMLVRGTENSAYAPIWDHMPAVEGEPESASGVTVNAEDLLPAEQTYYRYNGSLTTPPCTEGVKWFVMSTPVELSEAQIDAFRQVHSGNHRPVKPLNDRVFNPAVEASAPISLPVSGGAATPVGSALVGLGVLTTVAGISLNRRRTA